MDTIDEALDTDVPLPAAVLSALGKGDLQKFFRGAVKQPNTSQAFALWRKLILTTTSREVVHNHITVACNALYVFLKGAAASSVDDIRDFVHSEETWFEAYQCCQRAFNEGKTKPAFQVLETLCDLLQGFDEASVAKILARVALPVTRIVLLSSPRSELKKACLMLACLIKRTPILVHLEPVVEKCLELYHLTWMRRLAEHNIAPGEVSQVGTGGKSHLFLALIFAMAELDTRTAALKSISALCSSQEKQGETTSSLQALAQGVVELYLENNQVALGDFAETILPAILNSKEKLLTFVDRYTTSCYKDETRMAVFLAVLKVGRLQNLLSEEELLKICRTVATLEGFCPSEKEDDYFLFKRTMSSASSEIRILAYSLLTSSPSGNAIVPSGVLDCILSSFKYLHDDADAHGRGEILSITRRLLRRIQGGVLSLRKTKATPGATPEVGKKAETQCESFEQHFYSFLKDEMQAGVAYPRHSLSLHSLRCFLETTIIPDTFEHDIELVKILCSLVLDPFEDVRSIASDLLRSLAVRVPDLVSSVLNPELLSRVGTMAAKSVRGDHADGMARLWALSLVSNDSLPKSSHPQPGHITTAETGLLPLISLLEQLMWESGDIQPGSRHPIHAYLLSIQYRLRDFRSQGCELTKTDFVRIFDICVHVWDRVRAQLCVDSPETSSDLEDEDTNEGPKDLLAYSWRALRDSSLVLQSLILAAHPSRTVYSSIGDLCINQLISLRHRGAFSTVAQTFNLCCERVRTSPDAVTRGLVEAWYTIALHQIDEQADRLTRRSAGLPAMMVALLGPDDPRFFSTTVSDLMDISHRPVVNFSAEDSGIKKLPQVHALNCLKEIMTNSRFSAVVVQYLAGVLELAANCLSSKIWDIRNCGLMLLRACITRLGSTNTNEDSSAGDRHHRKVGEGNPFGIAVRLLESAEDSASKSFNSQSTATEHVFAALDLLGHMHLNYTMADEASSIITRQLSHSTWAVRDHAASLLATRLAGTSPPLAIKALLGESGLNKPENEAHGILLCCRYIMRLARGTTAESEVRTSLEVLRTSISMEEMRGRSPYVRATYLDVLNDAAALCLDHGCSFDALENAPSPASFQPHSEDNSIHWPYLSHRILLFRAYCYFLCDVSSSAAAQQERSEYSLITDSIASLDSLYYLLGVIKEKHCEKLHRSIIVFLTTLINRGYDELYCHPDILQLAFACLTSSLERLTDIPRDTLLQINGDLNLEQLPSTRELGNAVIELEAVLLGLDLPSPTPPKATQRRLQQWLYRLEFAAADSLDFPTRLSAARALSTYYRASKGSHGPVVPEAVTLRLLVVLYDLLNDDDEEVRFEAIRATRKLNPGRNPLTEDVGLCALAARELLLREIQEGYLDTEVLGQVALMQLIKVGQNVEDPTSTGLTSAPFQTTVASRLAAIIKSKNDLFAEEKQNLYIDDLRELKVWSQILCRCGLPFQSRAQSERAIQWALEGLKQLAHLLAIEQNSRMQNSATNRHNVEEVHEDTSLLHPLGSTYDHEILVVFLQVINLARVILACGEATATSKDLLKTLYAVREDCLCAQVNVVLLKAMNLALAEHCP